MAAILTIGAFGWSEPAFFNSLNAAGVRMFFDLRRRRGVRGAEYAFVNSLRLQHRLAAEGIAYAHRLDLAPSVAVRRAQADADAAAGIAKRRRTTLGPAFIAAYEAECLASFDAQQLLAEVGERSAVLFCVEREPAACHRSLVAARLAAAGAEVAHLTP